MIPFVVVDLQFLLVMLLSDRGKRVDEGVRVRGAGLRARGWVRGRRERFSPCVRTPRNAIRRDTYL